MIADGHGSWDSREKRTDMCHNGHRVGRFGRPPPFLREFVHAQHLSLAYPIDKGVKERTEQLSDEALSLEHNLGYPLTYKDIN